MDPPGPFLFDAPRRIVLGSPHCRLRGGIDEREGIATIGTATGRHRIALVAAIIFAIAPEAGQGARALCGGMGGIESAADLALHAARRTLVLTFDGGWTDAGSGAILDALRSRGVKATFFLAGRFIVENPGLVRRIVAEGHEVGNHTYHHDHLTAWISGIRRTRPDLTEAAFRDEMEKTAAAFRSVTGRSLAPLWRAPYGEVSEEILAWGERAGYAHLPWSEGLDALDWVDDPGSRLYRTPGDAVTRLLAKLGSRKVDEGAAILLMHLGSTRPEGLRFGDELPRLIAGAVDLGYRIETAGEAVREGLLP